ncbi:hypothetical protein C8R47DRAFT_1156803 [Mycena vitilis]|nr:hypothetical protein C8R47DRAFT_1156803 [Mycena vitilis]
MMLVDQKTSWNRARAPTQNAIPSCLGVLSWPSKLQSCRKLYRPENTIETIRQTTDHFRPPAIERESKRRRTDALITALFEFSCSFHWPSRISCTAGRKLLLLLSCSGLPFLSSYGLFTFGAAFAAGCAIVRSGSYRLIEPSVMYLIAFINFHRKPDEGDQSLYDPHASSWMFWLRVVIPIALLMLNNSALRPVGRHNGVVTVEYFVKIRNAIFVGIRDAICPCGWSRSTGALLTQFEPLANARQNVDTDEDTVPIHMKPDGLFDHIMYIIDMYEHPGCIFMDPQIETTSSC